MLIDIGRHLVEASLRGGFCTTAPMAIPWVIADFTPPAWPQKYFF
jgi:hypothetical protein